SFAARQRRTLDAASRRNALLQCGNPDMPTVLVVGSVAFDTIETPRGSALFVLGGAASYFSVSANFFTKVALIGVVGEDFPDHHRQFFVTKGIYTTGLVTQKCGKS